MHSASVFNGSCPGWLATISRLTHCSKIKVALRPTFSRPGNLGVKPILGLKTRLLLLSESVSGLPYDWLALSLLRLTTRDVFFLRLNPCGHSPYVTSCLTRRWMFYEYALPLFKCTLRICSMLLKIRPFAIYTSPLSVQFCKADYAYLI
jgi:hypothetical protein